MAFLIGTILFYMGESINEHFSINSAQLNFFFFKGLRIEFFEFNRGGGEQFVDYQLRGH